MYFFAPANLSIGRRFASTKFVTHLMEGTSERFDLTTDPGERNNLAAQTTKVSALERERLIAWARRSNASWTRFVTDR